jgi:hypothetical protein
MPLFQVVIKADFKLKITSYETKNMTLVALTNAVTVRSVVG